MAVLAEGELRLEVLAQQLLMALAVLTVVASWVAVVVVAASLVERVVRVEVVQVEDRVVFPLVAVVVAVLTVVAPLVAVAVVVALQV